MTQLKTARRVMQSLRSDFRDYSGPAMLPAPEPALNQTTYNWHSENIDKQRAGTVHTDCSHLKFKTFQTPKAIADSNSNEPIAIS
jgi:hypothetical protein